MDDDDWDRLIEDITDGECTPFLGAGASHPLPTGGELSNRLADEFGYPFLDRDNLPLVAHYAAIKLKEHVRLKKRVCRILADYGRPDFTKEAQPHALLAGLRLPVYITTNYDDFMVMALEEEGRTPHPAICPWYENTPADELLTTDRIFALSADEPIVYHLHGSCQKPRSLVLTEEDHLEFLLNLARDKEKLIPPSILPCFTEWPFLFIGYRLQDWTFRLIFHGLLRTVAGVQRRRHVSVQLPPLPDGDANAQARAREYLASYSEECKISVFWGTAQDFCTQLRVRLEGV